MRTRIVPASEITAKKGLKADTYVRTDEDRLKEKRLKALTQFSTAREKYLKANKWVMRVSKIEVPGSLTPRWWKDPSPEPGDENRYHREDRAVWIQEVRDNVLLNKKDAG